MSFKSSVKSRSLADDFLSCSGAKTDLSWTVKISSEGRIFFVIYSSFCSLFTKEATATYKILLQVVTKIV